ncbi:hypothetical protein OHB54_45485 [Streptomyces sp. NBC_01007]|nr:hypothetical protein OHB54_45485 [Streptomyces sp. NBC_01007]
MKWAHVVTVGGTALAAVAAIGGLWAQAVATYWSQETAKDQLSQSRDDAEHEVQQQARLVSSWTEQGEAHGKRRLHIMNRSRDPVYSVIFETRLVVLEKVTSPVMWAVTMDGDLGPCTELVYDEAKFHVLNGDPLLDYNSIPGTALFVEKLSFTDRAGIRWERVDGGLSVQKQMKVTRLKGVPMADLGEPAARELSGCESA